MPWAGVVFRGTRTKFAGDADFLSGEGSLLHGGRWNPPALCRVVYTSEELDTVLAEARAHARAYGIPDASLLPMTLRAVRCDLKFIMDLTDRRTRARLRLNLEDMMNEDWEALNRKGAEALSQAIGAAAHATGVEALLVPSATGKGRNLVIFPDNISHGSILAVDPET